MEGVRPLAVLGATGYTGRLVVERARELELPLRLVGRSRDALERLARPGEEIRVADARHEQELIAAFDGAFAVASTAGPFLALGTKPIGAAIAVGAHYLDTSGEQEFARTVYEGFGDSAEERELVLLTSFGFDYVPGDLAARLAAEELEEPLDEVVVAYATSGQVTSAGTRSTIGHVMSQRLVAWEDGLVPQPLRQDDAQRALSVRRADRRRMGRHGAADRATAHAGSSGPVVLPRAARRLRTEAWSAPSSVRSCDSPAASAATRRPRGSGSAICGRWSRRRRAARGGVARRCRAPTPTVSRRCSSPAVPMRCARARRGQ